MGAFSAVLVLVVSVCSPPVVTPLGALVVLHFLLGVVLSSMAGGSLLQHGEPNYAEIAFASLACVFLVCVAAEDKRAQGMSVVFGVVDLSVVAWCAATSSAGGLFALAQLGVAAMMAAQDDVVARWLAEPATADTGDSVAPSSPTPVSREPEEVAVRKDT